MFGLLGYTVDKNKVKDKEIKVRTDMSPCAAGEFVTIFLKKEEERPQKEGNSVDIHQYEVQRQ